MGNCKLPNVQTILAHSCVGAKDLADLAESIRVLPDAEVSSKLLKVVDATCNVLFQLSDRIDYNHIYDLTSGATGKAFSPDLFDE